MCPQSWCSYSPDCYLPVKGDDVRRRFSAGRRLHLKGVERPLSSGSSDPTVCLLTPLLPLHSTLHARRLLVMHTCSSWRASLMPSFELVPVASLGLPSLPPLQADPDGSGANARADHALATNLFLERVIALPSLLASHVRLYGSDADAQPALVSAALMALPPDVFQVELALSCSGPLLRALQRMPGLETLAITGNGAGIFWEGAGAASVVPKLVCLVLDYRRFWEKGQQGQWLLLDVGCPRGCLACRSHRPADLGAAHLLVLRQPGAHAPCSAASSAHTQPAHLRVFDRVRRASGCCAGAPATPRHHLSGHPCALRVQGQCNVWAKLGSAAAAGARRQLTEAQALASVYKHQIERDGCRGLR